MSLFKQGIGAAFTRDGTPISSFDEWVWPMTTFDGRRPDISDPFYDKAEGTRLGKRISKKTGKSRGHFGIDVLYPRRDGDKPEDFLTLTRLFAMFHNVPSVAAGPGKVFSAKMTSHGGEVKINHSVDGRPVLTVHRHLNPISSDIKKGKLVKAGEPVGIIFFSPEDREKVAHTHWELWFTNRPGSGREAWSVDPEPFLEKMPVLSFKTRGKLPARSSQFSSQFRRRKKEKPTGTAAKIIGLVFLGWAGLQWFSMVRK